MWVTRDNSRKGLDEMDVVSAAVAATQSVAATSSLVASASTAATGVVAEIESLVATVLPSIAASMLPSAVTTTVPVTISTVAIPPALEIASAFAGGLAGALTGVRRELDVVGVATLAVAAGLGGGIIRDVLLQKYGIYALENPHLLYSVLIAAALGFFFFAAASRIRPVLFVVDALALGLFACIGADKALLAGLAVLPAILLGTITSVGGGMLRDLLTDEMPQVLRPGSLYATAAVIGAMTYVALITWLNIVKPVATLLVVVLVLGLRILSQWLGWQSPTPTDLTPFVAAAPGKALRTSGRAIGRAGRIFGRPASSERGDEGPGEGYAPGADDSREGADTDL